MHPGDFARRVAPQRVFGRYEGTRDKGRCAWLTSPGEFPFPPAQATPSLPKPHRTPRPDSDAGPESLPFSEFVIPKDGAPSQPGSVAGSEVSYPSTPRFSDAGSSATDVMRRLEQLEVQLQEERTKRRETERRVLELLKMKKGD